MKTNKITDIDIVEKVKKNGEMIMRFLYTNCSGVHFSICLPSSRVLSHKGRKAYYILTINQKGTDVRYYYEQIKPVEWYNRLLWYCEMLEWKPVEVSRLQLLVETGRSVDHHLAIALSETHCSHICYKNEHNEYVISGVTKDNETGICERCGSKIEAYWISEYKSDDKEIKHYCVVNIRCKNGCWITNPDVKRLYQEFK